MLFARIDNFMRRFVEMSEERFDVIERIIDGKLNFNGCMIIQDEDGNISMDMTENLKSRSRTKKLARRAGSNIPRNLLRNNTMSTDPWQGRIYGPGTVRCHRQYF